MKKSSKVDAREAFDIIAKFERINSGKSIENIKKRAIISHWLQNEFPSPLLDKEQEVKWLELLEIKDKSLIAPLKIPFPHQENWGFRFIDLFAGIGGFRIALQNIGGKCVFSSEWNHAAQQTYYNNFGEYPFGDIRDFTGEAITDTTLNHIIPDHEILAAGFPCQPFSHAGVSARNSIGKQHGFECKTQGTLFFDILRVVKVKRPRILFLENVKNLQRHDKGRTFDIIINSLKELGYDPYPQIIDAAYFVPQHRERCYIICVRKDLDKSFVFPEISGEKKALRNILEKEPSLNLTISDKLWEGHINRTKRNVLRGTGFTAYTADINKPSNTLVARYGKDGKECLIPQDGKNPRLLSPRECARLQGFPEEFILPLSKTPAYHQFGNSVALPVIEMLAREILVQTKFDKYYADLK